MDPRPRRGFSQTSLEKLPVVELKKMCKERTDSMRTNGGKRDMGFFNGFMVNLPNFEKLQ